MRWGFLWVFLSSGIISAIIFMLMMANLNLEKYLKEEIFSIERDSVIRYSLKSINQAEKAYATYMEGFLEQDRSKLMRSIILLKTSRGFVEGTIKDPEGYCVHGVMESTESFSTTLAESSAPFSPDIKKRFERLVGAIEDCYTEIERFENANRKQMLSNFYSSLQETRIENIIGLTFITLFGIAIITVYMLRNRSHTKELKKNLEISHAISKSMQRSLVEKSFKKMLEYILKESLGVSKASFGLIMLKGEKEETVMIQGVDGQQISPHLDMEGGLGFDSMIKRDDWIAEAAGIDFDIIKSQRIQSEGRTIGKVVFGFVEDGIDRNELAMEEQLVCKIGYIIDLMVKRESLESENLFQQETMLQQNKLAAMGEMLHNIAHQWRQPINTINLIAFNMLANAQSQEPEHKKLEESYNGIINLTADMSRIISDFQTFFRPNKTKECFSVKESIEIATSIIASSLETKGIDFTLEDATTKKTLGFKNELSQVVINIVSNAQYELLRNKINDPFIKLRAYDYQDGLRIDIEDNAGGIKKELLAKVFQPYFSTKPDHEGSGIGLHMCKTILEKHMSGTIEVKNRGEGALFSIIVPVCR